MKSYTDLNQSKKLADILPIESADCYWDYDEMQKFHRICWFEDGFNKESQLRFNENNVCAWSLAALRACLPPGISIDGILYVFESHNTFDNEWVYEYKFEDISAPLYSKSSNEIDACVNMIIQLKENKMI